MASDARTLATRTPAAPPDRPAWIIASIGGLVVLLAVGFVGPSVRLDGLVSDSVAVVDVEGGAWAWCAGAWIGVLLTGLLWRFWRRWAALMLVPIGALVLAIVQELHREVNDLNDYLDVEGSIAGISNPVDRASSARDVTAVRPGWALRILDLSVACFVIVLVAATIDGFRYRRTRITRSRSAVMCPPPSDI